MQAAPRIQHLMKKLEALPLAKVAEVEDFIDFLASRDSERMLVKGAQAITANSLKAVWDNADDAEYDRL